VDIPNIRLAIEAQGWLKSPPMVTQPPIARQQMALALSARGWSQVRIARTLGISRQRVHQILHRPRRAYPLDEQRVDPGRLAELSVRLRSQRQRLKELRMLLRQQRAKHLHRRYLMAHPKAKA